MKHAQKRAGVSAACQRAVNSRNNLIQTIIIQLKSMFKVEDLLRITDAGSDWQVDTLLKDACSSVVETACSNRESNPTGVISCLMEKSVLSFFFSLILNLNHLFKLKTLYKCRVYAEVMTTDCRTALLEIQV